MCKTLFFIIILSFSSAQARIAFEPYFSYGQGELEKKPLNSLTVDRALWSAKSLNYGARLGFLENNMFIALDFEKSKTSFKEKSNPLTIDIDYESDFYSYGLSFAYTLPSIPLRLMMRWLYRVQGSEDINFIGNGMVFGISYTGFDWFIINSEFKSYTYDRAEDVDLDDDKRYFISDFTLGISRVF